MSVFVSVVIVEVEANKDKYMDSARFEIQMDYRNFVLVGLI